MAEVQTWPGSKIKDYCILNAKRIVEKIKRDRPPVMPTGLVDEPGSFAMGGLLAEVRTLPESNMKKYCIWNAERMIEESKSASAREFSGSTGAPLSHCYPKRFCYRPILDSTSQPSPSLSAYLKFPPPYHLAHNWEVSPGARAVLPTVRSVPRQTR